MPELPEVEAAARIARRTAQGQVVKRVRVLHRAQRKGLSDRVAGSLSGERVGSIIRRGKYQALGLSSGRWLVVHFRMTGDWAVRRVGDTTPLDAHARVVIEFANGSALVLVDARALATVGVVAGAGDPFPRLGPEANGKDFTQAWLHNRLTGRRGAIKVALLDQTVVAGVGNIYASEALWRARIDPRVVASTLTRAQVAGVVRATKATIARALKGGGRYSQGTYEGRFAVYDREGEPCRRCRATIVRIVQAGRSTYYCPRCVTKEKRR